MGTWVMGTPVAPQAKPANRSPAAWVVGTPVAPQVKTANQSPAPWVAVDYVPSPPPVGSPKLKNHPYSYATNGDGSVVPYQPPSNPYVQMVPVSKEKSSTSTPSSDTIFKALERCGKQLEATTKKTGGFAGSVWNHLRTGPSVTDAAMSRIYQETKVIAEGGHEKIYQQTFGMLPGEKFQKSYACYLSTSNGPVIGTLYVSTARLAFCSDNHLYYTPSPGRQEWTYYKVVVPLGRLKAVNSSTSKSSSSEKYIQIVTVDGHEFWFMGLVSYEKALKNLKEIVPHHGLKA